MNGKVLLLQYHGKVTVMNSKPANRNVVLEMTNQGKILIVEDEKVIREFMCKLLISLNYQVDTTCDGIEAVNKIKNTEYSVILSDVKMPRMSGIELLKRVKEINKNIEVILITGFPNIEDAEKSIQLGAYAYTKKPIKIKNLIKLLNRIFKKTDSAEYV